jgi:streptogrisin C
VLSSLVTACSGHEDEDWDGEAVKRVEGALVAADGATGAAPDPGDLSGRAALPVGDDSVQMDLPPGVVAQSAAEARKMDLSLVAEARGWSLDEASASLKATEAVGNVAVKLANERPDLFVGSVVSEDPLGSPSLLVKGEADEYVKKLVAEEDVPINVVDGQPFSSVELDEQIQATHKALRSAGYQEITVTADIQRHGKIVATLRARDGLDSRPGDIAKMVLANSHVNPEVIVSNSSLGHLSAPFGGMRVWDAWTPECTSGWSVGLYLFPVWIVSGVTTAGHCTGIDGIDEPGIGLRNFPFEEEHIGAWGDIEYHSASVNAPDDFYATDTDVRDVQSVEPAASISINESVCFYSRLQGTRFCTPRVRYTNVTAFGASRLVHMTAQVGIGGDSGGGWSYNNKAYGSLVGNCVVNGYFGDVFSVADYYPSALGWDGQVMF